MLKLEPRPQPSKFWSAGSPILALLVTVALVIPQLKRKLAKKL